MQNGPFRTAKWAVLRCDMGRIASRNGPNRKSVVIRHVSGMAIGYHYKGCVNVVFLCYFMRDMFAIPRKMLNFVIIFSSEPILRRLCIDIFSDCLCRWHSWLLCRLEAIYAAADDRRGARALAMTRRKLPLRWRWPVATKSLTDWNCRHRWHRVMSRY